MLVGDRIGLLVGLIGPDPENYLGDSFQNIIHTGGGGWFNSVPMYFSWYFSRYFIGRDGVF